MDYAVLNQIKLLVKNAKHIAFLGGAGVSTASGIDDFRSPRGLYNIKSKYGIPYEIMLSHSYFHEDTETFTIAYTEYDSDYQTFYQQALHDAEKAKETREYGLDSANHPNWFDASCIPWISYDSLTVELPDGYLYFNPIINWGSYCEENGRMMMPVSVRMNHAVADGYLVARVFVLLEQEMKTLCV